MVINLTNLPENCGKLMLFSELKDGEIPKLRISTVITIKLEGGAITEVKGIPRGVLLQVNDYDTDGGISAQLRQDQDNRHYILSQFTALSS